VDERVPLSLTADRGRLGLDLNTSVDVGPLTVDNLVLVFGNLRFPLDLSGGVPAFRHRRGQLERITLSVDLEELKRWITSRLQAALGRLERPIDLWFTQSGIGFGWVTESSAVTGDLYWASFGDTARFVLGNARGVSLHEPVLALVVRIIDWVLARSFERRGRVWVSPQVSRRIARLVLPAAGARVPSASGVNFGALKQQESRLRVHLDVQLSELCLPPFVVRSLELAELAVAADEALVRGKLEVARQEYLRALESAPRHRDLVLSVAELDMLAGGREHAALGLLSDALPAVTAGPIGAELLRLTGDQEAALEALDTSIRSESYAPLRALLQVRQARFESDASRRFAALDSAVASAPALASVRWARFEARAARGDAIGALEDTAFLESSAQGTESKFQVCTRSGGLLQRSGLAKQAAKCFERALRYCPDEPEAAVGLAKAFIELQQPMRAVSLLERAAQKGDPASSTVGGGLLLLAHILAEEVKDLPGAIARLRQIPAGSDTATEARALEARWRHALGDMVGASIAWARMRDEIELGFACEASVHWLREASEFERNVRGDLACAERHLAAALRMSPHDEGLRLAYRQLASVVAAEKVSRRE